MNSYQRTALILGVAMVFTLAKWNSFALAQDRAVHPSMRARAILRSLQGQSYATLRQGQRRTILHGLQECAVTVENLGPEIERGGLTTKQLQTDTELKLRLAGIKVLSWEESLQAKGSPFFHLWVRVLKLQSGCYSCVITAELLEVVFPERKPHYPIAASTCQMPSFMGFTCRLTDIRQWAKDIVDEFINDYLAANPK